MRVAALHDSQLCSVKSSELSVSKVTGHDSESTVTSKCGRRQDCSQESMLRHGRPDDTKNIDPRSLCVCNVSFSLSANLRKVSVATGKEKEFNWSPVNALGVLTPVSRASKKEHSCHMCKWQQNILRKSDVFLILDGFNAISI